VFPAACVQYLPKDIRLILELSFAVVRKELFCRTVCQNFLALIFRYALNYVRKIFVHVFSPDVKL
jgi:hypothetical protein